jgi:hypothetical protein
MTVPRATPSCAARSRQEDNLAPGVNVPFSMAAIIPERICSASVVVARVLRPSLRT